MPIIERLSGKHVLVLLAPEFEDAEFRDVVGPLTIMGADITVASTFEGALDGKRREVSVISDKPVGGINVHEYEALYIPGGRSPAKLRDNPDVQALTREAFEQGLRIGAVCHGPQVLISAGIAKNKTMTAYPSVGKELEEAGANYTGQPVERDGSITTATDPTALSEFNTVFIREIACCEVFGP